MKNLFKKLMLVAVAAMAFAACSQDVNEVNKVEKVTRYEFTAEIADDTRSGFAEKEDGATAYKSEWHEGDQVKIFIDGYEPIVADITTEGNFDLELTDAPELFFVTVVSPAESWADQNTANIPAEQTPLANSVDPKAHLLQAQAVPVSGASAHVGMNHMAAYGKMTVNGVAFAIDHVVVDLKGTFYGYDRVLSYTINAANVENNTFWFATQPIDVAEFTVTAYDAEGNAVAKTVSMEGKEKPLAFNYGRVSTFSVSGLEAAAPEFTDMVFTSATVLEEGNYGSSDFLLQLTADNGDYMVLNMFNICVDYEDQWSLPQGDYEICGASDSIIYGDGFSYVVVGGVSYDLFGGTMTIAEVDNKYSFTLTNVYVLPGDEFVSFNASYLGSVDGILLSSEIVEVTGVSASATLGTKQGDTNYHALTITLSNGVSYTIEVRTEGKNYLPVGNYTPDWSMYQSGNAASYIYCAYKNTDLQANCTGATVSYADDQYTISFTIFDMTKWISTTYTYVGSVDGIGAPEDTEGGDEPEQPEVNVKEVEIERIYVASYGSDYDLTFYIKNEGYSNILMNVWASTYNTSGTYSFAYNGDTSNGFANYSTHQYKGTPITSGELTVVVDGNTRTFDFVFVVGGETYHFNYTHVE